MRRGIRAVAMAEAADAVRDPYALGWLTTLALASYALTYSVGASRAAYWIRITFVMVPLGMCFVLASRRGSPSDAAYRRLLLTHPITASDIFWGRCVGSMCFFGAYLALVTPQMVLYLVAVPPLIPLTVAAVGAFILLSLAIVFVSMALQSRPMRSSSILQGVLFLILFFAVSAAALADGRSLLLHSILGLVPSVSAAYAAGAMVDTASTIGIAFLLSTCAVFTSGVVARLVWSHDRPWLRSAAVLGVVMLVAVSMAHANSVRSIESRKTAILTSDFAVGFLKPDHSRLTPRSNLPIGEPAQVLLTFWGDRPPKSEGTFRVEAENAVFTPDAFKVPPGEARYVVPIQIELLPRDAAADQKHVVLLTWERDGETLTGRLLIEGEVPYFKAGVSLAAVSSLALLLLAWRRSRLAAEGPIPPQDADNLTHG